MNNRAEEFQKLLLHHGSIINNCGLMRISIPFTMRAVVVITLATLVLASSASAQFAPFKSTGLSMQIYTMGTDGAASLYNLKISVATNGLIAGSGKRFDVAAAVPNANPLAGTSVSLNTTYSRVGLPIVAETNKSTYVEAYSKRTLTNTLITTNAPASIVLSDGTRFKGVISKTKYIGQYWDGSKVVTDTNSGVSTSLTGGATRGGRFGFASGSASTW